MSSIGTILRDQYAIPLVKPITGKSISDTLQASGLAPTMPEDLANLMKKAQSLAVHMDKNKKDLHNKRNMQIIEARIHKLSRYYKREGVIAKNFEVRSKNRLCNLTVSCPNFSVPCIVDAPALNPISAF